MDHDLCGNGIDAGNTDLMGQVIKISCGQEWEMERDTLLHEVLHVLDYAGHLEVTEKQVHAMANSLLQVLRDNPKFVAYLTAKR